MKYKYLFTALCIGCFYHSDANALWGVQDKIYSAAKRGDAAAISSYLNRGYSIDTTDSSGVTALCQAYYDGAWSAYNLLVRYGANSNAQCMHKKPGNMSKTVIGVIGIAAIGGGAVAIASSGGGHSGGGDNNDTDKNDSGKTDDGKGSGSDDKSGENADGYQVISKEQETELRQIMASGLSDMGYTDKDSKDFRFFKPEDFRKDKEYTGRYFGDYSSAGIHFSSVNFHDAVQAATAYSKFYGLDSNGKLVSKINKDVIVGVLDTGVDPKHKEFQDSGGNSRVFGHNYDYGPCRGNDRKNCWLVENDCDGKLCYSQTRTFYDEEGNKTFLDNRSGVFLNGQGKFEKWAAMYPEDYDWDNPEVQNDPSPLKGYNPLTGESSHGTHIAGIIGANWDRKNETGMMGIAFSNTKIDAVRWDLVSPMFLPIERLVKDGATVINMSIGRSADRNSNASKIYKSIDSLYYGYLDAAIYTIRDMTLVKYKSYSAYDGTIWVKAAGNENYNEPDLESGIKNLGIRTVDGNKVDFGKLQMLVVTSVNVTLNDDGTVASYKKSSFANSCGSTASYCISAPGGDYTSGEQGDIYSSAEGSYLAMHGTSQATPVVTGSIAFLKTAFPFLHASEIIEILLQTANTNGEGYNHNTEYHDATYGAGLIDLGKAATYYIEPDGMNGMSTVTGNHVDSETVRVDNANLNLTGPMADAMYNALPKELVVFDKYHRPFKLPIGNYVEVTHSGFAAFKNDVNHIVPNQRIQRENQGNMTFSYVEGPLNKPGFGLIDVEFQSGKSTSGFFLSENTRYNHIHSNSADLSNPFMSFNSAYGVRYGYDVNPKWELKFEAMGGENGLYDGDRDAHDRNFTRPAYGFNSEVAFRPTSNTRLAFSSGMLYEDEALLGMNGTNAFGLEHSQTYHTGITAAWKASPKLTLSGSYYTGFTKAQNFESNMLGTSDLISDSFAFDANYKWNKNTDFGFRLSSPLRVEHGKVFVDFASGRDDYSDEVYRSRYSADLKPNRREYKFAWYLNKDLSEDISFSSEFDVRVNPEHRDAANDYRALFGLTWNF